MFDPADHKEYVESKCVVIEPDSSTHMSQKISKRWYRCDNRFWLEPLQEMSECKEKAVNGLLWCDHTDEVLLYQVLATGENQVVQRFSSHLKNSHRKGGQSQHRFERLVSHQRRDFWKYVAEQVQQHSLWKTFTHFSVAANRDKINHLKPYLPESQFIIIDGHIDSVHSILDQLNWSDSTASALIQEFYNQIHCPDSKIVYGREDTLASLVAGQLKVMFSTDPSDEEMCQNMGTQWVKLSSSLNDEWITKFLNEFGTTGGLLRWN